MEEEILQQQYEELLSKLENKEEVQPPTDPIATVGRVVLDEMWSTEDLNGKRFIITKLKPLVDPNCKVAKEPQSFKKLCAINLVKQYLTTAHDPFSWEDSWSQWISQRVMPNELKAYCLYVFRNFNYMAYPEEAWAWGDPLAPLWQPEEEDTSEDESIEEDDEDDEDEGDEEDEAIEEDEEETANEEEDE